ncbi:BRF1 RNA polymerase III transcription initiation factor subunit a isoform X2 [Melanotaenia boesemani]|uniref:BRF1 RNA polymerase III transcription initiation factor subunit a isoform X2 n=1 Tax=Melanotaenia boesemani TaxID=1250792 RepID=UPI001C05817C|nr:BRF1 RNA polymerase III transcription initiation factor subunit a isoform X2 [Melanotaenia boesemani]
MSSKVCKNCGSSNIDVDQARGDAVCMGCGTVLEDNIIVSEVEFVETGGGGSLAVGQFVSSEGGPRHPSFGDGHFTGMASESRAKTLQRAKQQINTLGHQLQMNQHCLDTAHNFYKMALMKHLTRGRKSSHIMAACIYMVCRTEGTPHMLLDLSDILQVNVYVLGKTFLLLARELCINAPAIALLVAARLHDFRRTVKEVISVVKVCENTLKRRLSEFEETPTSQLTIEEFMKVDLDQECDPPCFTAGLRKKKAQQLEMELKKKMDEVEDEIQEYQDEIDAELESSRPKLRGIYAAYAKEDIKDDDINSTSSKLADDEVSDEDDELQAVAKHFGKELDELTVEALIKLEKKQPEEEDVPKRKAPSLASILGTMPSSATLGLPESISNCVGDGKENDGAADSGELDLSGIDDSEIELYLLSDNEIKIKTALWMAENSDYLKEQKEKEAKIAKEKELGIYKEKKRRAPGKRRPPIRANNAEEAIEKMLEQKKISCKINYDVLKDLNIKPAASPACKVKSPKKEPSDAKLPGRSRRPAPAPLSLSTPLSSLGKRLQPFITRQPNKKLAVEQTSTPLPTPVQAPASGVVVESGPVVYDDGDEEEEEEEETCVSAMELLGGNDYGSDGDYDDGF